MRWGEFKISLRDPKNRKMLGCGIVVIPRVRRKCIGKLI